MMRIERNEPEREMTLENRLMHFANWLREQGFSIKTTNGNEELSMIDINSLVWDYVGT